MSTPDNNESACASTCPGVFAPCARCGAAGPETCQKTETQDCQLLLPHNRRYVCRCCMAWVGDAHDRHCKLAQGIVTMEFAMDKPLLVEAENPRGVEDTGPCATSAIPLRLRRIFRAALADEFMALPDEDKRQMFVACATDAQNLACMYSNRMSAVWPNVVPDLTMLVRRLAYALQHCSPGHPLAQEAMEHLRDRKMLGHALPGATVPDDAG
jgi:hypothetical protein